MKKVIVITGGSDGLGKSLAKELMQENDVIILSTNEEKMKNIGCPYYVCDIRNFEIVQSVIDKILKDYGHIDVLVNNAGLWTYGELVDNDNKLIEEIIQVNLLGLINCTKAVVPSMKERKDGLIIQINSQSGISAKEERTIYNASKWGVTGFSKSLQLELMKYGIRVTDVRPGRMKTSLFIKNGIKKEPSGLDLEQVIRTIQFVIETTKDVLIPEIGIISMKLVK